MSGRKTKKGPKPLGKAIWVKATPRQLDILDAIDPVFGKTAGDRLLYAFLRWIDEKGSGIFAQSEEEVEDLGDGHEDEVEE